MSDGGEVETGGTVEPWESIDGTRWLADRVGWTGWMPGEDGTWFMTDDEFRRNYGDEKPPPPLNRHLPWNAP